MAWRSDDLPSIGRRISVPFLLLGRSIAGPCLDWLKPFATILNDVEFCYTLARKCLMFNLC
ncbi:hypothetical protein CUJ84_Chr003687 [Rhizobium leguminosarum]|uniref:Uncharacterized protein n=1 Tax=Rhizobium leguminosarum TaxID=384 RepID=A0A2K9Z703_RHILE|nr:hypothetical protein CUJ84_Chr003687 [Rhizobium leguminosarum]